MEITIKGTEKEIVDLVREIQKRLSPENNHVKLGCGGTFTIGN